MTKRLLVLAAATALATPQLGLAQQPVTTPDPAATTATAVTPAAVAPATTASPAYPGAATTYPASTAYPAASYPPQMPGAVAGSVAADRDGDGVIDGYYTSDGIYHPNTAPSLPPPRFASRRGERG